MGHLLRETALEGANEPLARPIFQRHTRVANVDVTEPNAAAIQNREDHRVRDHGPKFFHQVERQCWLARRSSGWTRVDERAILREHDNDLDEAR